MAVYIFDSDGNEREIRLATGTTQGFVDVQVLKNGEVIGTPHRYKMASAGRVASDSPGVNPDLFVTDSQGRITDG